MWCVVSTLLGHRATEQKELLPLIITYNLYGWFDSFCDTLLLVFLIIPKKRKRTSLIVCFILHYVMAPQTINPSKYALTFCININYCLLHKLWNEGTGGTGFKGGGRILCTMYLFIKKQHYQQ